MTETAVLSIVELFELVEGIFLSGGCSKQQAAAITRVIVAGERDGCKSHGIYRVEGCLRTMKAGKVVPDAVPLLAIDDSAIVRVDAQGGFSNAAFELGLPALVTRTRELGLAALVINNCTHFAALWPEVEAIAEQGMAAIAMCPSLAAVAPAGGRLPLLGTNPLAFGWPRENDNPYVFDFATSVAARGEIELHRRAGKALPEGWALDTNGEPTTDPVDALAGAMLPFGGHKGSAISTMIELLAAAMIGDRMSPEALEVLGTTAMAPNHGELIIAFDPGKFSGQRKGNPLAHAETLFEGIMGQGARLPSQRRFAARAKSEASGIEISAAEMAGLQELRRG